MEMHKPTIPQIDVVGPGERGGAGRPATGFFAEMEKNTNFNAAELERLKKRFLKLDAFVPPFYSVSALSPTPPRTSPDLLSESRKCN